jgi:hypothetical protein
MDQPREDAREDRIEDGGRIRHCPATSQEVAPQPQDHLQLDSIRRH